MCRDVIVYFGMGFLPEGNAVACRQQTLAEMIRSLGYTPVLIGIDRDLPWHQFKKQTFNGVDCYSLRYASSLKDKLYDSFAIKKTFSKIFEDIGIERIKCFIMQDYQFNTMQKMNRFCRKNKIAFVADLMDWFTPTSDYSLGKNIFKSIDMLLRASFLYPFLNNRICISSKFYDRFYNQKQNQVVIPCTSTKIGVFHTSNSTNDEAISIVFAGEPGLKFQKEKLDWVIQALYENNSKIEMHIFGITRDCLVSRCNKLQQYLTDYIHFYGKTSRDECISVLKKSDFSIIPRQVNNLSTYGFSSKICESFACGVPVITTDTSDNKKYVIDGKTGFVCDSNYEAIKSLLKNIGQLSPATIEEMRSNLRESNPLSAERYTEQLSSFIENLIV